VPNGRMMGGAHLFTLKHLNRQTGLKSIAIGGSRNLVAAKNFADVGEDLELLRQSYCNQIAPHVLKTDGRPN